jgi:hypothetical protein
MNLPVKKEGCSACTVSALLRALKGSLVNNLNTS